MYPRYYSSHFSDLKDIGEIVSVDQLNDTIVLKTSEHYLLYTGIPLGGWQLAAIKDLDKNDLAVEDFINGDDP